MPRQDPAFPATKPGAAPLVLGFDNSGAWVRAALLRGQSVLAAQDIAMARGQGERLFPELEALLSTAGQGWQALDALGVGTGPGNFTGIRIAVAAARGLALGLGIPAIGVNRFEALSLRGPSLPALVPAPRGMAWRCALGGAPTLVDSATLTGRHLAEPGDFTGTDTAPPALPLAVAIALLAGERLHGNQNARPKPLYLREADAAPASDTPPPLLD
ncbi:MAG: tRNA (adenosine(37)-N6)-threonylcarbamoyltransferase complex dimerization subunit type 1 TsaB [Pararhodobacter sp.]|nr:tRNA (adenosine(37)-N6)-threonylcarbamoyltransferase complex dimerization subunit type 1 TsaB [Pararhodobacter sp.]